MYKRKLALNDQHVGVWTVRKQMKGIDRLHNEEKKKIMTQSAWFKYTKMDSCKSSSAYKNMYAFGNCRV